MILSKIFSRHPFLPVFSSPDPSGPSGSKTTDSGKAGLFSPRKLCAAGALFLAAGMLLPVQSLSAAEEKLKIVTTIFPEYDWVMNILGDQAENIDVTWLMDTGVDLHNFNPSVDNIVTISNCDLFVYVGGESDFWVDNIIAQAANDNQVAVSLMELLGDRVLEEKIKEGMQLSHVEETGSDEHVWLSLKNAGIFCSELARILGELDPAHAAEYTENAEKYTEQLEKLDAGYSSSLSDAPRKTLVFGDRFPFLYLFNDYGLDYYAAFNGCSAESEASFNTIIFLADKLDELGLDTILKTEGDDNGICKTVIQSTSTGDQKILVLDSMQAAKREDYSEGLTYLSSMEKNLETLREACGA